MLPRRINTIIIYLGIIFLNLHNVHPAFLEFDLDIDNCLIHIFWSNIQGKQDYPLQQKSGLIVSPSNSFVVQNLNFTNNSIQTYLIFVKPGKVIRKYTRHCNIHIHNVESYIEFHKGRFPLYNAIRYLEETVIPITSHPGRKSIEPDSSQVLDWSPTCVLFIVRNKNTNFVHYIIRSLKHVLFYKTSYFLQIGEQVYSIQLFDSKYSSSNLFPLTTLSAANSIAQQGMMTLHWHALHSDFRGIPIILGSLPTQIQNPSSQYICEHPNNLLEDDTITDTGNNAKQQVYLVI